MRSYVAVSSSCCLLYLLLQWGSQVGCARGVAAAVAALPFLLSCASDLPRCLMSQSMWPLSWRLQVDLRAVDLRAVYGRRRRLTRLTSCKDGRPQYKYKAVKDKNTRHEAHLARSSLGN
jgi:hypothetical protein